MCLERLYMKSAKDHQRDLHYFGRHGWNTHCWSPCSHKAQSSLPRWAGRFPSVVFLTWWRQWRSLWSCAAFGHVLLRVEDDDVDFGHVEHPQRHRRAEAERDGEGGGLDVHLETTHIRRNRERGKVKVSQRRTTSLCSSFFRVWSLYSQNNQLF